jgi:hypothetical protein
MCVQCMILMCETYELWMNEFCMKFPLLSLEILNLWYNIKWTFYFWMCLNKGRHAWIGGGKSTQVFNKLLLNKKDMIIKIGFYKK